MHGLGNDFIIASGLELAEHGTRELALALCDRNKGIGADGLLLYFPDRDAALSMRLFNSDGSEAEMCGNGIRCLARFAHEEKLVDTEKFNISTKAGIRHVRVYPGEGGSFDVEVNMGAPRLTRGEIPVAGDETSRFIQERIEAGGKEYTATCVNMGNPHCVIFVESFQGISLRQDGAAIERSHIFPAKTNVEFANIREKDLIEVEVWERGAGETLACGTGACATLVAAHLTGRTAREATILLPGGPLSISWLDDDSVVMRGPAVRVYEGVCDVRALLECISLPS